ncbi:MAG TPA: PH domain-containing protein [Acidimicrobiales bacterium]|nr:PH domain-containing protein [Acidimicrobiales bacterium]
MPFPKQLLSPDEKVALDLRPHWWFIAPAAAYLVIAVIIGIFVLTADHDNTAWKALEFLAGIAVLIALGNFAMRYAKWHTTNFVVTNERVISRSGVVAKKGIEIPLDRINTVFFSQGFFERLIGAGDLGIESAGEGGRQNFSDVRKPAFVQQEIYRQKEALEAAQHSRLGSSIAASMQQVQPAAPTFSIPDQIEQLDRLRKAGAITEDEFQLKKAELLRRL